jgi:spire-like protein
MSKICVLDEDNCLSLDSILKAFHCGIKEEHSWALIYQAIDSLKQYLSQNVHECNVYQLFSSTHFFIKNDGTIHQKSWHSSDIKVTVKNLISSIGSLIYEALDYGNDCDEEFLIMSSLEHVFDIMTQESPIDEGIEEEEDDCEKLFSNIIDICRNHIFDNRNVCEHYRNVCRALVAEAIEMSTFLNQISIGTKELQKKNENNNQEVDKFQVQVWAHLWMKVMHELRVGVTLKSIDKQDLRDRQKREYELTPFEILLDDINSKRYTLKKVMSLPKKIEKDARTLILDFIRSRPPLRPVTERQLKPLPQTQPCLHEKLMEGIKQTHSLKPTPPLIRKFDSFHMPRGKRYSDIYPLSLKAIHETKNASENTLGNISETSTQNMSTFRRLSFRNLSLRQSSVDRNRPVKASSQTPVTRRFSFWGKICQSFW